MKTYTIESIKAIMDNLTFDIKDDKGNIVAQFEITPSGTIIIDKTDEISVMIS